VSYKVTNETTMSPPRITQGAIRLQEAGRKEHLPLCLQKRLESDIIGVFRR
jgi:hypothetical protein